MATLSMFTSNHYLDALPELSVVGVCCFSQQSLGEGRAALWRSCQFIAGLHGETNVHLLFTLAHLSPLRINHLVTSPCTHARNSRGSELNPQPSDCEAIELITASSTSSINMTHFAFSGCDKQKECNHLLQ